MPKSQLLDNWSKATSLSSDVVVDFTKKATGYSSNLAQSKILSDVDLESLKKNDRTNKPYIISEMGSFKDEVKVAAAKEDD